MPRCKPATLLILGLEAIAALSPPSWRAVGTALQPEPVCEERLPEPSWPVERETGSLTSCKDYPPPDTIINWAKLLKRSKKVSPAQHKETWGVLDAIGNFSKQQIQDFQTSWRELGPSRALQAARNASFMLFLAAPRSGHTLIGSLIDAHPNAVLANEFDVFGRYLGIVDPAKEYLEDASANLTSREDIFSALLAQSTSCGFLGRVQTGYDYSVRGAHNGQWSCRIDAIGDKKGGHLTHELLGTGDRHLGGGHQLSADMVLKRFGDMLDILRVPALKMIVVRDNDDHNHVADSLEMLRSQMKWPHEASDGHLTSLDVLEVQDFACSPKTWMVKLCTFLGLDQDEEYLQKVVAKVDTSYCHHTGARSGSDRRKGITADDKRQKSDKKKDDGARSGSDRRKGITADDKRQKSDKKKDDE